MKSDFLKFKIFINYFKKFFLSVNWYETTNKKNIINKTKGNKKLIILKSRADVSKKKLNEYFEKYKIKLKRFNGKSYFLALVNRKKILSSGWIYLGAKWKITEINKNVYLNSQFLLFDFETPAHLRNKGYYTLLLELIRKKFPNKKLAIYSLSNNTKSTNAIKKSGFKLIKKINGIRN